MLQLTKVVDTFPASHIENTSGALPVEVSLIAQLGHGAGNHLFASVAARQTAHNEFIDELDEPSVKLGGVNLSLGDTTSLYSFIVGPKAIHSINMLAIVFLLLFLVVVAHNYVFLLSAQRAWNKTHNALSMRCALLIFHQIACLPYGLEVKHGISSGRLLKTHYIQCFLPYLHIPMN